MKRSIDRILTTHVGSLPRPADLLDLVRAKEDGKPIDEKAHTARLREAVADVVRKQTDLGKGGSAIPYHQEDPAIREEFQQALAREGVASRMNKEFYQRPPAEGEVVMGDVM